MTMQNRIGWNPGLLLLGTLGPVLLLVFGVLPYIVCTSGCGYLQARGLERVQTFSEQVVWNLDSAGLSLRCPRCHRHCTEMKMYWRNVD